MLRCLTVALNKSQSVVLHSRPQGETSKIISLYTLGFGKMSVIAKGARGIKSRFGGSLEPFTHFDMVFYRKETRELQFLSQADIIEPFANIHKQLGKIALASIVCELIDRHEVPGHASPRLFQLLLEALTGLNENEKWLRNFVRAFALHFADLSGFRPELQHCSHCGRISKGEAVWFNFESGSFACASCPASSAGTIRISDQVWQCLRFWQASAIRQAGQVGLTPEQGVLADQVVFTFLSHHMESVRYLSSLKYIQQLEETLKVNHK
jgi:DNA repair protein RecO (recombination protein O)